LNSQVNPPTRKSLPVGIQMTTIYASNLSHLNLLCKSLPIHFKSAEVQSKVNTQCIHLLISPLQ